MRNVVKKIFTIIGVVIGGLVMYVITPTICIIGLFSICLIGMEAVRVWDICEMRMNIAGYDDGIYYEDSDFFGSVNYAEYYFNEKSVKKFEKKKKYSIVNESDIEEIQNYFSIFEHFLKWTDFEGEYTFDKGIQIDVGDYYYIYDEFKEEPYINFDVYYVDMDCNTVYYIHKNV